MSDHSYHRFYQIIIGICSLYFILCFNAGCAVERGTVYEKDGKLYGKTEGLFKAQWDDFYQRGLSYGEGGYWEDARKDFQAAIQQRDKDQRHARTYGMHFIDYFPKRELGIACYNLGKYHEAIKALENSLANSETARAQFYLDKARRAWLNETRLDTDPPVVTVKFPPPLYRTSAFSVPVEGTARDDFFVSNVIFNKKASKLELSRKEVSFKETLVLHQGKNVITLQSEDILGKASLPVTIQVNVDRDGPLILLELKQDRKRVITVTGAVYDTSSIARITLNDRELTGKEKHLLLVNEKFSEKSLSDDASFRFEAEDVLGNITSGNLRLSSPIMLKGLRDGQQMFHETLTIEGSVTSAKGIDDLTVNGQSLLPLEADQSGAAFLKLLRTKKGIPLSFSKTIQLEEGENRITATLSDVKRNMSKTTCTITRRIPKVKQIASRLSVAIFPFTEKKKAKEPLRNYVQTFLTRSFVDQKRFNVLKRDQLTRVMEEEQASRESLLDQETAVRLGRHLDSETILTGDIRASEASIEILAHLVDTKTSSILVEKDIYWEGKVTAGFRGVLDALALKFKQQIPLCEGNVTQTMPDDVIIDLGTNRAIQQGMKFLAFSEGETLIDPETGMDLGSETDIIGLLSAKEVDQTFSKADVVKKFTGSGIQAGTRVITK